MYRWGVLSSILLTAYTADVLWDDVRQRTGVRNSSWSSGRTKLIQTKALPTWAQLVTRGSKQYHPKMNGLINGSLWILVCNLIKRTNKAHTNIRHFWGHKQKDGTYSLHKSQICFVFLSPHLFPHYKLLKRNIFYQELKYVSQVKLVSMVAFGWEYQNWTN